MKSRGKIMDFKFNNVLSHGEYLLKNYSNYSPLECLLLNAKSDNNYLAFERIFSKSLNGFEFQNSIVIDLNLDAIHGICHQTKNEEIYDYLFEIIRKYGLYQFNYE